MGAECAATGRQCGHSSPNTMPRPTVDHLLHLQPPAAASAPRRGAGWGPGPGSGWASRGGVGTPCVGAPKAFWSVHGAPQPLASRLWTA